MFWIEFFGVFVLWFLENNVAIDFYYLHSED